ncbi:MAG TPA: hypothetical protein VNG51_15945 [Ktedonobacteraceae bacterium]|nr:hypothetical protein [Ktedonobacteraceae bacterium]
MNTQSPCQEWLPKLALKQEDFSSSEWDAFSLHLKNCSACSARRTEYGVIIAELSTLPSLISRDVLCSSRLLFNTHEDIQPEEELTYSLSIRAEHETQREKTNYGGHSSHFTDSSKKLLYRETKTLATEKTEKTIKHGPLAYSGLICLELCFLLWSLGFFVMTQAFLMPSQALITATPSVNSGINANSIVVQATNLVGMYYADIATQNYYQAYTMLDNNLQKNVGYGDFLKDPNYTLYAGWNWQNTNAEGMYSVVWPPDNGLWTTNVSVQIAYPALNVSDNSNLLPVQYNWNFQVVKDDYRLAINSVKLSNVTEASKSQSSQERYPDSIHLHYRMIWKEGHLGTNVPPSLHNKNRWSS